MSTQTPPTRTETEFETDTDVGAVPPRIDRDDGRTPISTRTAPQTFSPDSTDPCPQLFADRWRAEPDGRR
ncbi:MAG: hypothetical protein ABEH56_06680 [Salinirussus sp.]